MLVQNQSLASPSHQTKLVQSVALESKIQLSGFSLAIIANILWGTSFLASKYTLLAWGPFTASFLRFIVAIVVMLIVFPIAGFKIKLPKTRAALKTILLIGFSGFGILYPLQLKGLTLISSSLSAAIMLTSPLILIGLSAIFLKERASSRKMIALAFGVIGGCVLLLSPEKLISIETNSLMLGSLLTFAASLCLATSVIATRKAPSEMDSANLTFWSILVGLFVLAPFAYSEEAIKIPHTYNFSFSLIALAYLGVICSAFCFLIWNKAISLSSPKELATTMHIKTPTAVIFGVTLANETLSLSIAVGTIIVGIGVWLSQSEQRKA